MASTTACDQYYRAVPAEQREALQRFRASHPLRHFTYGKTTWEYIACGQGPRTLLIQAKGDTGFTATEQAALAATYPLAQVQTIASGRHQVAFIRPEEYLALLEKFLLAPG
jgi:hypothetical protein